MIDPVTLVQIGVSMVLLVGAWWLLK